MKQVAVLVELTGKGICGGVFVVVFALLAQTLSPKRFAGVFAGVPTVAVASLLVTTAAKGPTADAVACTGMVAGAVALLVYCLVVPHAVRRLGALKGSAAALVAWFAVAAAGWPLVSSAPSAAPATVLPALRPRAAVRRPRLGCDPGKLRQCSLGDVAVRFGFGAATSVVAGLISREFDPVAGGAFLAFPAVLLASLTLVADEEGQSAARDDARGAAAGSVGMVAFAAVGAAAFGSMATPAAFVLSSAAWLVVALATYGVAWWLGAGDDEQRD